MRISRANRFLERKIKKPAALRLAISFLKKRGKTVVFTNGCFDLLHYGHVRYLEAAKQKGDVLIVAINSDASVRRIKGKGRPLVGQEDRLRTVAGLESVDYVTLFCEDTPLEIISLVKPHILVKGSDWDKADIVGREIVLGYGGKVVTVKLLRGRSTTNLIKKIARANKTNS
jgi:D-beta-D-heptose 7-phosphate kinase/D-beta-D-heptose 1-phosphate adenosyltransferase